MRQGAAGVDVENVGMDAVGLLERFVAAAADAELQNDDHHD